MAAQEAVMADYAPNKRPRLDSLLDSEEEWNGITNKKLSPVSESLSGPSGESTLTSDSGFNEFTPPQSMDEDSMKITTSLPSYSFENKDMTEDSVSSDNMYPRRNSELAEMDEDDDDDDASSIASTASNLSGMSNLSNMSGKDWKPCAGPMSWVQQQMVKGVNPRSVLTQLLGSSWSVPDGVSDFMLWHLIVNMLSEPPRRERLRHINTIQDVVRLIRVCKKILVLTGAGVSVSCGIPDFRSKDGIYARLSVDFPDLPDPQAMFDIHYFRKDPRPFFKFAREIYPGQFSPSQSHKFIRFIEQKRKLLRNYTQNIDTLEQVAGIDRVIQCHGSFATATCQKCSNNVSSDVIKEDIMQQRIPICPSCDAVCLTRSKFDNLPSPVTHIESRVLPVTPDSTDVDCDSSLVSQSDQPSLKPLKQVEETTEDGNNDPIMKPDIVFFGEGLPAEFHDRMAEDKDECDLLIVIGSSLKVRPVALIPSSLPANVPQILINREPLGHLTFDVELLGDCDAIVGELCHRLGEDWKGLASTEPLSEIQELPPKVEDEAALTEASKSRDPTVPHPRDESDIEALRACWAPKVRESVADRLPEGKFLYTGGHRYVFPGAEVYYDPDDTETSSNSSSSSSRDFDEETPSSLTVVDAGDLKNRPKAESSRRSASESDFVPVDSLYLAASCSDPAENHWGANEALKDIESHLTVPSSDVDDVVSASDGQSTQLTSQQVSTSL